MHRNVHRHTRPRAHTHKRILVFLHFRFDFTCRSKCLQHFWNYLSSSFSSSLSYFSPFLLLLPSSPHCFLLILNYFSLPNPIASFFFSLSCFVLFYSSLSSTLFYFAFSCPSFIHHFAFFTFFSLSSFVFFILFSLTVIFCFLYSFFTSSSSSPCFLLFLLVLSLFLHYFLSFSSYIFPLFLLLIEWGKGAFNFLWFTAIIENNADLKKNKKHFC